MYGCVCAGSTPLEIATQCENDEMIAFLTSKGGKTSPDCPVCGKKLAAPYIKTDQGDAHEACA
jgi:hypothetical protein